MIRSDAVWLAKQPRDMRAGIDSCLARIVKVFGSSHPHTSDLFANRRANCLKVLVHNDPRELFSGQKKGTPR